MQVGKVDISKLKIIKKTKDFKIEEVGNIITGNVHNEMFIYGWLKVDKIIYLVKKYKIKTVWYASGTNTTHTFPLIIKLRDVNDKLNMFGDVEFLYPII